MDEGNWTLPPDPDEEAAKDKKSMILLVIFSLILIGELIYFTKFYNKYPLLDLFIPKPTPNLYPYYVPTRAPKPTKVPDPLSFLSIDITPSVNEFISKGTIVEIDPNTDPSQSEFYFYLNNQNRNSYFHFDKNELISMKVYDHNGKLITYKDLHLNQYIYLNRKLILNENIKYDTKIIVDK